MTWMLFISQKKNVPCLNTGQRSKLSTTDWKKFISQINSVEMSRIKMTKSHRNIPPMMRDMDMPFETKDGRNVTTNIWERNQYCAILCDLKCKLHFNCQNVMNYNNTKCFVHTNILLGTFGILYTVILLFMIRTHV